MQMPDMTLRVTPAPVPVTPSRSGGIAGTISRWALYALFALLPVFFLPVPWIGVGEAKILLATILILAGLIAWVASIVQRGYIVLPKRFFLIAVAAVPVVYLVSALVTGASWESLIGDGTSKDTVIGMTLWYVALVLGASLFSSSSSGSMLAIKLLIISSAAVLATQLIHLFVPTLELGGALTGPSSSLVGSWHDLGIFLGLVLFLALSLSNVGKFTGAWKAAAIAVGCVALFMLIIINYSDVWLGVLGLAVLWLVFLYRIRITGANVFATGGLWLWLVVGSIAVGMYFFGDTVQTVLPSQLQVAQFEVRPSWQGTFAIGREVFAEPAQIFFGSGPNTFIREWALYKPLSVNETQFWNVDFYYGVGFIPTSFVTTGILGLLAWGMVFFALLYLLRRALSEDARDLVGGSVILVGAVYLTIFHVLYVPGPTLSLLTFLLFGLLLAEHATKGARWTIPLSWTTWQGKISTPVAVILGIVVVFGGVQSLRALTSDLLVNKAVVAYYTTGDLNAVSRDVARAAAIHQGNDRAHRASVELGILQLSELIAANDSERAQELQTTLDSTIQHGLRAVSIEDDNYLNWLTLARLYGELAGVGIEGAEENARDAYAEARRTNPTNPVVYLGEAQLDIALGNDTAARASLEQAVATKPNMPVAYFLLSQLEARAGDLTKAADYAGAVVQLAEQDPLGWYNLGTILYVQQNYPVAALALERAVGLENNYANALYLLALSYFALERREESLALLHRVQELNSNDEALAAVIGRVETGLSPFAE